MARKYSFSARPTSVMRTTLGWSSMEAMRASSRNMSMKSGFTARWGKTFFTTTRVLKPDSSPCRARYTSAMPPTASRESNWYRPRVTNCCTAGPGGGAGACKPMPIGGKGVRWTYDSESLRPVLSARDEPLAGVAAGFFVPVSGGGPRVGIQVGQIQLTAGRVVVEQELRGHDRGGTKQVYRRHRQDLDRVGVGRYRDIRLRS